MVFTGNAKAPAFADLAQRSDDEGFSPSNVDLFEAVVRR
jgi:hypothetical protein